MSRTSRADLVAAIDDCFEHAESAHAGRKQATALLSKVMSQNEALGSFSEALEWIASRCPLEACDMSYLAKYMMLMTQPAMASVAERYVVTWMAAVEAEPSLHCKANAGRRAANVILRGTTPFTPRPARRRPPRTRTCGYGRAAMMILPG
ncbi:hypothetical protein [Halomonas salinarum]|uniref:hypothetical protein n=1 Tax=Halomonas salinarum TaxID=1158993 RepID=UPI001ADEBD99|nr:hypothetical protein [Halomonas salinarum]